MDTILDFLLFLALCNLSPENGHPLTLVISSTVYLNSRIQNLKAFNDIRLMPHTVLKYQTLVIPKLPVCFLLRCSGSNSSALTVSHGHS